MSTQSSLSFERVRYLNVSLSKLPTSPPARPLPSFSESGLSNKNNTTPWMCMVLFCFDCRNAVVNAYHVIPVIASQILYLSLYNVLNSLFICACSL